MEKRKFTEEQRKARNERNRQYRKENAEKVNAYNRKYRREHAEELNARRRARRAEVLSGACGEAAKEQAVESESKYRLEHRELIRERSREYHAEHREEILARKRRRRAEARQAKELAAFEARRESELAAFNARFDGELKELSERHAAELAGLDAELADKLRERAGIQAELDVREESRKTARELSEHSKRMSCARCLERMELHVTECSGCRDGLLSNGAEPVEPAKPAKPVESVESVKPVEPAKPAKPAKPVESVKPAESEAGKELQARLERRREQSRKSSRECAARRRAEAKAERERARRLERLKAEEELRGISPLPLDVTVRLIERLNGAGVSEEGIRWRLEHDAEVSESCRRSHEVLQGKASDVRGSELTKRLVEASRTKVRCPICGEYDNDWKPRGGLCCTCWCRELNMRYYDQDPILR